MQLTNQQIQLFHEELHGFYREHARANLPWRQPELDGSFDPYKILVSEIMLQQTQVNRVIPKYLEFLRQFPKAVDLARAEQGAVLRAWSGLGYNRRAKYLHQAAKTISMQDFPQTITELVKLPGVGKNTAGAIMAYTYNQRAIFIETNIRTVYIHHFFHDSTDISDTQIADLLEQTMDTVNLRDFYWALMDYGSYLKQTVGNLNKWSSTYSKQSRFKGSIRQLRGQVLRELHEGDKTIKELRDSIADERLPAVLQALLEEGMVQFANKKYHL